MNYRDEEVIKLLKKSEGFRAKPYKDPKGHLTIGYGTLLERGLSKEEAEALLRIRLSNSVNELLRRRPFVINLPDATQKGLCRMVYSLGAPRLLRFHRMWRALVRGSLQTAAEEALDSDWREDVGRNRALSIARMIYNYGPKKLRDVRGTLHKPEVGKESKKK